MKPSNLALRLSGVFLGSALLAAIITLIGIFFIKQPKGSISQEIIMLVWAAISYVINYILSCKLLQRKEKQWGISLVEGTLYKKFERGTYLKFYLGFVWRLFFLNTLLSPVLEKISGGQDNDFVFSIVVTSLFLFLSYLWLLKFPYGSLSMRFNVTHKEVIPTVEEFETISETRTSDDVFSVIRNIFVGAGASTLYICYFLVGCIQFAAIFDFFHDVWNWWWIPSAIVSGVIAYIPIIGGIAGIYSAYTLWDWPLLGAIMLFCWPILIIIGVYIFSILNSMYKWLCDLSNK